jgi:cytochrome c peroxidase
MNKFLAAATLIGLIAKTLFAVAPYAQVVSPNEKIELGRALFFDKRLSANGTVSCASCHDPASAFASRDALPPGVNNQKGTRNAPTLLNAASSKSYFWDGRASTLEQQARFPLLAATEMGMKTEAAVVERITNIADYRAQFRRVFPHKGVTFDAIVQAIAAFERTLVSHDSPFDRFLSGEATAITEGQKQGWELFKGKAKCIECHTLSKVSPFFSDGKFHNTGIRARELTFENLVHNAGELTARSKARRLDSTSLAHDPEFSDLGRYLLTLAPQDLGAFKTPGLRDVELTGPYMHDGSIHTLLDVVRFYNQGGVKNARLDEKIKPLNLSEEEMSKLVEFLRALTSDDVLRLVQTSKPETREATRTPY